MWVIPTAFVSDAVTSRSSLAVCFIAGTVFPHIQFWRKKVKISEIALQMHSGQNTAVDKILNEGGKELL